MPFAIFNPEFSVDSRRTLGIGFAKVSQRPTSVFADLQPSGFGDRVGEVLVDNRGSCDQEGRPIGLSVRLGSRGHGICRPDAPFSRSGGSNTSCYLLLLSTAH